MHTGVYDILFINHIYFKKNITKHKINPSKTEQNEVLQEGELEENTFYCSDIELEERNIQHPLLWATDGIIQAFSKEKCRIVYKNVEGDFGKGDCGQ